MGTGKPRRQRQLRAKSQYGVGVRLAGGPGIVASGECL